MLQSGIFEEKKNSAVRCISFSNVHEFTATETRSKVGFSALVNEMHHVKDIFACFAG